MRFSPYKLHTDFDDGEPLIPEGWIPFLWAEDLNHYPQACPVSVPVPGEIVALLLDRRLLPDEAYMTKLMNGLTPPRAKNGVDSILIELFYKRTRIRKVILARYKGLDQYGCPDFTNVGAGSDNPDDWYRNTSMIDHCSVAWKRIDIPYLPDVTI